MAKSYSFPHLQFGLLFLLMIHLFFSHSGFCVTSVSNSSTTGCKRAERQALLKLRDNIVMNKRMSNDFPAWDGEDCYQWRGVSCDNNTGFVIETLISTTTTTLLVLQFVNVVFVVGLNAGYVSKLNLQHDPDNVFYRNEFYILDTSQVLSPLLELEYLTHLDLSGIDFGGNSMPKFMGSFRHLRYLNLSYTGDSYTGLSGEVPAELGNLTNLVELDLSFNHTSATRLDWASRLLKLQSLNMNYLNLSKARDSRQVLFRLTCPSYMTSLVEIDLSHNFLTENLHKQTCSILDLFGHNCSIRYLYLNNNSFEGHIPSSLGYCTDLTDLDLTHNKLSGKLPTWKTNNLPFLETLQLNGNQLGVTTQNGSLVHSDSRISAIPSALCNFTSLIILHLQENMFSGEIPDCWTTDSALFSINLSANKLSGPIPCSLGHIKGLDLLHLNDNMLSGGIPSCLNGLHHLSLLDIGGNQLWGEIPKWLNHTHFPDLVVLRLQGNMFNGTISEKLCSFPRLRVLDLSNNRFTATIPLCLGNLTSINNISTYTLPFGVLDNHQLDISVNEIVAGIQREYTSTLVYLTTINLSSNYLVGSIPSELTKLSGLKVPNLSHNHLTGDIPEKIGDMKSLETLDLSMNSLCGRIPSSISSIDSMNYLNLSYNNLSGEIPTGSHFQTLSQPSVYAGNPLLCGETLTKKCSSHDEPPENSGDDGEDDQDKREKMWFYLVVMAGLATGFWGVVGTLLVNKRWRHALFRHVDDASDWLYVTVALWKVKLKRTLNLDN